MTGVDWFNATEAVFWIALAVLTALFGRGTRGFTSRTQAATVVFLAAFGVSDIIELYTGAWWEPPALLVFKALCLTGLVLCASVIYGRRWRGRQAPSNSAEAPPA
jgi:hypothetical protein